MPPSTISYLDIVDCNAGDHHHAFATNFNPEINIREITQKGLYYKDGQWIETEPLEIHKPLTYPNIGPRESYLLHHEELESLVKNYPTIKQGRFWMTFGEQYLKHLDVIQNIGMSRIDEIEYEAPLADGSGTAKVKIVPLQFLKAVLPNPQDLGENYEGETSIGCRIRGIKDGKERTYYVYNNCKHQEAYKEKSGLDMIQAAVFIKNSVDEATGNAFLEKLQASIEAAIADPTKVEAGLSVFKDDEATAQYGFNPTVVVNVFKQKNALGVNAMGLGFKKAIDIKSDIDAFLSIFSINQTSEEIYFK